MEPFPLLFSDCAALALPGLALPSLALPSLVLPSLALPSLEFLSLEKLETLARHYGYWAVFLGILLENAGLPLPGESITLVGGFLAGSGDLRLGGVLASAFGGAVLGDNLGYWLGRWGGWALVQRIGRLLRLSEAELEKGQERFRANATIAVTLGRFVTFLRIFAGPMAGMVAMPYPRFLVCNALGALLWVLTIVGLAYGAGQLVPLAVLADWLARFGMVALILVAIWVGSVVWLRRSKAIVAKAEAKAAEDAKATDAEQKLESQPEPESESTAASKPEPESEPEPQSVLKLESGLEPQSEPEPEPESSTEPALEPETDPKSSLNPGLSLNSAPTSSKSDLD